jgi:hypothetical protein
VLQNENHFLCTLHTIKYKTMKYKTRILWRPNPAPRHTQTEKLPQVLGTVHPMNDLGKDTA